MKIYIDDSKNLVVITSPKTIRVDLSIRIDESLKHDIKFTVSCHESLAEYKIKKKFTYFYMNIKKELSYLLQSLNYI